MRVGMRCQGESGVKVGGNQHLCIDLIAMAALLVTTPNPRFPAPTTTTTPTIAHPNALKQCFAVPSNRGRQNRNPALYGRIAL